jgi:hypothetical protein
MTSGPLPTPDPTPLTTEQLLREIDRLEKLMESAVGGLRDVVNEQFESVDKQFQLVERQRVEQKRDTEVGVAAALSAAKEAVKEQTTASGLSITKSETATNEQMKQINVTFTTAINAVTAAVNDLKEQVVRIESVKQGGHDSLTGLQGIVMVLLSGGSLAIGAYIATH